MSSVQRGPIVLTFDQIKELMQLVAERKLAVLEVERSGFRIRIEGDRSAPVASAGVAGVTIADSTMEAGATRPAAEVAAAPSPAGEGVQPAEEEAEVAAGAHVLKSPIVGTFYRAPSPDADPYVQVGERVKRGQVLCIVEAMKLMNEIESDEDGVIEEILIRNAQPVEFGEPLFAIRPD